MTDKKEVVHADLDRPEFKDLPVLLETIEKLSISSPEEYKYNAELVLSGHQRLEQSKEFFGPMQEPLEKSLKEMKNRRKVVENIAKEVMEEGRVNAKLYYEDLKKERAENRSESPDIDLPVIVSVLGRVENRKGDLVEITDEKEFLKQCMKGNIPAELFEIKIKVSPTKNYLKKNSEMIKKWKPFLKFEKDATLSLVIKS